MALEAVPGAISEDAATGPLVYRRKGVHGAHGYLPSVPEMQAVFIASGPGIKAGVNLHYIQMTTFAPTILKALGIDAPQFGSYLAIFIPGCCSGNPPVWSETGTGVMNPQGTRAQNKRQTLESPPLQGPP